MTNEIRAGHRTRISYAAAKRLALVALALVAFLVACSSSSRDPGEEAKSISEQVTAAPDVVVTATSVSPAGVAPSQPATFSATVKNQGTVATSAGTIIGVAFAVDGTTVNWSDTDTQSLAPGQSITLTANSGPNSGASTWTAASGNHTLRAWVDDVNRIAETDETNNQLTIPLNIASDLIVTSITASPSSVAPGQPVTFSATVKNQGTNATPPGTIIGVAFAVDGTTVNWSDTDTQSLAPGQSVTLTANSGPNSGASTWSASAGAHTVRAWVDDLNRIVESDDTNNQLSVPLSIGIDLTVTAVAPTAPVIGSPTTFSAVVKNAGTSATPAGTIVGVAFAVDGATVSWSDTDTQSLAPGQSVTLTANSGPNSGSSTWTATSGTHTLQAWVDDVNRMNDVNRDNNKLITSFTSQTQQNGGGGSGGASGAGGMSGSGGVAGSGGGGAGGVGGMSGAAGSSGSAGTGGGTSSGGSSSVFGAAVDYNVFVFQDLSVTPTIAGPVAAGRDVSAQGFGYNTSAAGSIGVVAGRNFTGSTGSVHRDLVYGSTLSLSNVGVLQGVSRQGTPINFTTEKARLEKVSADLAELTATGTTTIHPDGTTIDFSGSDASLNVFSVGGAALGSTSDLNFIVPATSTVVVNVSGSSATFQTMGMHLGALTPGHLIWNFPQATTVSVSLAGFEGTLLAPDAAVTQSGSGLDGVLIATSLVGGDNGLTWKPFNGTLPACVGTGNCCVRSCASKHCGDNLNDGCGGNCPPVCGTNDPGCTSTSDCETGLTCTAITSGSGAQNVCIVPGRACNDASDCAGTEICGHQNGANFGQNPALSMCEPGVCQSIDRALNPCLDPANAGKQTACGPCPICVPQCNGRSCGDDHCGGSCGTCGDGGACVGGSCLGTNAVLSKLRTGPVPRNGIPFPEQQLGSVPGPIPATFSVNASGQAMYHIPLEVAPGRGGLQPDLALDYNSGQGNGVLGVGWSLQGLSVISRCDKTVAQDALASTPLFSDNTDAPDAFCLDGKRLIQVGGGDDFNEYRTEVEEFSQIIGHFGDVGIAWFEVRTKNGRTLEFGNTENSNIPRSVAQMSNGATASLSYLLDKVEDRAGNTIRFQYDPRVSTDAGYEFLVTSIIYGWHDGESVPSAPDTVVFNYEGRDDKLFGWKYGARQNVNDRIASIDIAAASGVFRRYALSYQIEGLPTTDGSHRGRSVLTDITECARTPSLTAWDPQQPGCKTPIHFDYSAPVVSSTGPSLPSPFDLLDVPIDVGGKSIPIPPDESSSIKVYSLDLNGDGRTDFLLPEWHNADLEGASRDTNCQPFPAGHSTDVGVGSCHAEWHVFLSQPDGSYLSQDTGIATIFQYPQSAPLMDGFYSFARVCPGTGIVGDFNNDGKDELLETGCDDEGFDQKHYAVIALVDGSMKRVDLNNVPFGGLLSTGPSNAPGEPDRDTSKAAAYVLDVDGDGTPDLLECHSNDQWTLYPNAHGGNLADSFGAGHTVTITDAHCGAWGPGEHTVVDVDGDGRDELILRVSNLWSGPEKQRIVRFDTQGVVSQDEETNLSLLESVDLNRPLYKTLDINGDGLVDFMSASGKIDINRGDGQFQKFSQNPIDVGWGTATGNEIGANAQSVFRQSLPMDVNGDGMQDLVVPGKSNWVWLRSTGTQFELEQFPQAVPLPPEDGEFYAWWETPVLADLDGDSFPEVVQFRQTQFVVNGTFPVLRFTGPAQPELTAVTDSLDARTEVSYSHLKDASVYTPGAGCAYPQHCEGKTPRRLVSKVDAWDKHQHPSDLEFTLPAKETTYQYSDGRLDLPRRAWLGFSDKESRESVDPGTPAARLISQISEFFDLDTYDATAHLYPFAHQPRETDSTDEIGGESGRYRRSKTINSLASRTENVKGIFTWSASEVSSVYEGTSFLDEVQLSGRTLNVDPPDQYGNETHSTQSWSDAGGFVEARDVTTSLEWQFHTITAPWQISQVRQRTETSTVPATGLSKSRQDTYSYFPNGLLHTEIRGTTEAEGRTTTLGLDAYGNITSIVALDDEGNSRSVTVGYDPLGFAPTTITNGKGQITHVTVDARFGSITHTVDPNNLTSDTWFDNFGRTVLQVAPDGTTKSTSYQFGPFLELRPTRIQTSESGGETITTDLDVLGREIHSERTGLGGSLIAQSQSFDSRGFPQKVEWPHKDAVTAPKTTLSVFDNLGRITALIQPVGTTSSCYENRTSCETNAVGYTTCKITDALGRLIASIDPHAGDPEDCRTALAAAASRPATTYTYGPFGDLSSVRDVNGNVTTVETDNYGRRTAVVDPDSGRRTFGYNGLDELTRTEDANSNIVAFIRDALGRVKQRQETRDFHPEIPERDTNWTWDGDGGTTTDALVGALTQVVTPEGHTDTYHYDHATGRLKSHDELVAGNGGGTFSVSFEYDVNGLIQNVNYPRVAGQHDVTVHHNYDSFGHLIGLTDPTQVISVRPFWSIDPSIATDDYEQLTHETFGNGVQTTRSYTPNGWVEDIQSTFSSNNHVSALQHVHYSLDADGNVLNRQDLVRTQWESFAYDHMGRLGCSLVGSNTDPAALSPTCTGTLTASYSHDDLGRITGSLGAGTYSYPLASAAAHPVHAPTTVGDTTYTYDNNGNRSRQIDGAGNARGFSWTAFNKPLETWREGTTPSDKLDLVHFEYDANQTRLKKETSTLITAYLDGLYEQRKSKIGAATEHVFYVSDGARVVAQITQTAGQSADAVQYMQDDHLGSAQLLTDSAGTVLEERSYDAFGQSRNAENWAQNLSGSAVANHNTSGFTGQERDDEFGQVNMRGREYDPRIGQFLQADPIVQDPENSQFLNRYAYVTNNPLKFVDPSGFDQGQAPDPGPAPSTPTKSGPFSDAGDLKAPSGTKPSGDGSPGLRQLTGENWRSTQGPVEGKPSGSSGHPGASSAPAFDAHSPGADGPGQSLSGASQGTIAARNPVAASPNAKRIGWVVDQVVGGYKSAKSSYFAKIGTWIGIAIGLQYKRHHPRTFVNQRLITIVKQLKGNVGGLTEPDARPDAFDPDTGAVWEVRPDGKAASATRDAERYAAQLRAAGITNAHAGNPSGNEAWGASLSFDWGPYSVVSDTHVSYPGAITYELNFMSPGNALAIAAAGVLSGATAATNVVVRLGALP